jgi:hypothetical protein
MQHARGSSRRRICGSGNNGFLSKRLHARLATTGFKEKISLSAAANARPAFSRAGVFSAHAVRAQQVLQPLCEIHPWPILLWPLHTRNAFAVFTEAGSAQLLSNALQANSNRRVGSLGA